MKRFYTILGALLVVITAVGIHPASIWGVSQPKAPKCLKK